MVMLLQTLMAQRQAQQVRRDQYREEQEKERLKEKERELQRDQAQEELKNGLNNVSVWPSTSNKKTSEAVAAPLLGAQSSSTSLGALGNTNNNNAGFSIVDFDFGDDEDDPDFDPSKMGLVDFQNVDFANAFSSANTPSLGGTAMVNQSLGGTDTENANFGKTEGSGEDAWQQLMMLSQGNGSSSNNENNATLSASARAGNGGRVNLSTNDHTAQALEQAPQDTSAAGSRSSSAEVPKGRFTYSREEAAERRRESNRECARRQRARKKEEQEEMKRQLELAKHGSPSITENIELPPKRKPGRPRGSKARQRDTSADSSATAPKSAQDSMSAAEVADLKADNRMIRAELTRLREENAQLRAQVMRWEDERAEAAIGGSTRRERGRERPSHQGKRGVAGLFRWDGGRSLASPPRRRREDEDDDEYFSEDEERWERWAQTRATRPAGAKRADRSGGGPPLSKRPRHNDSDGLSLNHLLASKDGRALEALLQVAQGASSSSAHT